MKLIWKELLHANYRCGRMHTNRAPASDVYCMLPRLRECAPECDSSSSGRPHCPVRL